ncbi:DEAD/DEAH box helicase [Clostridium paridis]|uniref:DEAD/DEAH box helicase family protein n=1 Tax=Clostridium paridis TaxID=2803863 RepID=A0A937K4U7_9CLOT|nr:DEAD/DEAH box helicase family protein [Clostridium paridis]MBL4933042.1 DEAD/DEAH box helicase family protein [Clostridium paridis]
MINLLDGLFEFQENCVSFLLDKSSDLNSKQVILVKSPTGSGKTIMLIDFIDKYLDNIDPETCFVWLCPGDGELEEQSKSKMDKFLNNRPTNDINDVLLQGFNQGETTFINWQKVTKKGNKAITDSERSNLFERIADAHRKGITFMVIIDEEHRNNTSKAKDVIDAFSAKNIIRVSATTKEDKLSEWYEINEIDVINSGLITRALYVNEGIEDSISYDIANEHDYLINLADEKRKAIAEEYQRLGKVIRPLVIIQFPNSSDVMIKTVERKLENMGYSYKNGMLAKWLDNDKINIDNITPNDSIPVFLLMKQAISTGWDCPRAKVLVKLRENMSEDFEIQTIGRLRRMPETKHYDNTLLDNCYLYTFDEKYKESVLGGGNAFEVKRVFLKDKCKTFTLTKQTRDLDFDMLGEKETLIKAYKFLQEKYKLSENFNDNKKILEANSFIFGTTLTENVRQGKFIKTADIARNDLGGFLSVNFEVNTHSNGIDLLHSIDMIKREIGMTSQKTKAILKHLFFSKTRSQYKLLKLDNREWYAFMINNRRQLRDDFADLTAQSVRQINMALMPKTSEFRIPLEELYRCDPTDTDVEEILSSAYEKYNSSMVVEGIRSKSERLLENYCEDNENVDWVYKNGDKGLQYFSIVYTTSLQHQQLFYPDYIVKLKNGDVWILETKGGELNGQDKNIDKQVCNKFNAFKEYAEFYNVKWAFVRDKNEKLKYNNTEYSDQLISENWKPLKDLF